MGQVHAYARVVKTMAANPTGQFFDFEEKCPVGSQDSKTTCALKVAVKPSTFIICPNVTALTCD